MSIDLLFDLGDSYRHRQLTASSNSSKRRSPTKSSRRLPSRKPSIRRASDPRQLSFPFFDALGEVEGLAATVATLDAWDAWDDYPESWPCSPGAGRPLGTVALTPEIERMAGARRAGIARDMAGAGLHFPRDEVRAVLDYWGIQI